MGLGDANNPKTKKKKGQEMREGDHGKAIQEGGEGKSGTDGDMRVIKVRRRELGIEIERHLCEVCALVGVCCLCLVETNKERGNALEDLQART